MQTTDVITVTTTKEFTVGQFWEAVFGCDGSGITYWSPKIRKQNGHGIDLWKTVNGELQPNPQDFKVWDSEESKWHFVSLEQLRNGFELALKAGETHCGGHPLDVEDYDSCFCDIVIQYAIFGKLIYG